MKEAKVVSRLLREHGDMNASASKSLFIRGHTLGVMLDLCYERSTVENSTGYDLHIVQIYFYYYVVRDNILYLFCFVC